MMSHVQEKGQAEEIGKLQRKTEMKKENGKKYSKSCEKNEMCL